MNNPLMQTTFGFHWRYNVCDASGPLKAFGRVYYVDDGFGNLCLVDFRNLTASLA